MKLNAQNLDNSFVCYTISVNGALHYIGLAPARMVTLFDGAEIPDGEFTVEVVKQDTDFMKCATVAMAVGQDAGRPDLLNRIRAAIIAHQQRNGRPRILCVDTGKIFKNAAAACREYGVATSNMSAHLNNMVGYRKIKGMTFVKVG